MNIISRSLLIFATATVSFAACAQTTSAPEPEWKKIPIPPLHAFKPPQPKRIELSNGMVIFLQEDHELPLIDGSIRIRGGSQLEPSAKVGLVDLYGEVWRTGGTKTQTGDQLDDYLEARAAKVETGGGTKPAGAMAGCGKDSGGTFNAWPTIRRASA